MVYATHKTQLHYQLNFSSTEAAFGLPCGSDDDDIHLATHRDVFTYTLHTKPLLRCAHASHFCGLNLHNNDDKNMNIVVKWENT